MGVAGSMSQIAERLRALSIELSSAATQIGSDDDARPLISDAIERARSEQILRAAHAILTLRQRRSQFFPQDLFGEPCWDMLLDLFIAREEKKSISVSGLCLAAQVPQATALRYINKLEQRGDLLRAPDSRDCRRTLVRISDSAADAMKACLAMVITRMVAIG